MRVLAAMASTFHRLGPLGVGFAALGLGTAVVREADRIARAVAPGPPPRLDELGIAPADGRPVLVLVADPECDACRAALDDRDRLHAPALGVVPVHVRPPRGAAFVLPSWLLFDGDGTPLGILRGYRPPETVREWVVDRLGRPP